MFFYSSLTIKNHLISPLKELRKSIWTIASTQKPSFDRTWLLATPWNRRGGEKIQLLLIHDLGSRWG
jgi:hypothetical protein